MRYDLLGRLEVRDDQGGVVEIGGAQPRLLVAMLLVARRAVVTTDALVDAIWGDEPPRDPLGVLQTYVSRLRRVLGATVLRYEAPGYRLLADDDDVDAWRFERLADDGRAALDGGDPAAAHALLLQAERLWRGPALLDVRDRPLVDGVAVRLEERRLLAVEDRLLAELQLGRHGEAVAELRELVAAHPYREGLRARLAMALYRSGRQADALRSLDEARRQLAEELGVDPGPELRRLEAAILQHDPALAAPAPPVRAAATETGSRDGQPFVGRAAELAALVTVLDESVDGARMVVLEGEPGIGKTRLADELGRHARQRGGAVVWGRCHEGTGAPALWPWLAVLRSLVDLDPAVVDDQVLALLAPDVDALEPAPVLTAFRLHEAVRVALQRAAAPGPLVVVLDDLQWADEASLELVTYLATSLEAPGVLLLMTVRRLALGRTDRLVDALAVIARRSSSRRMQLRRLSDDAVRTLAGSVVGGEAGEEVLGAIAGRAEGNPFYAIELARLVEASGLDGLEAVPPSVRDVVRQRLAALGPSTLELLEVASVHGRDVRVDVLAAAAGVDPGTALEGLEPARAHRLLVDVPEEPGRYRFAHALVREVLTDDLSTARRARLHLAVADALQAHGGGHDDDAELVAEHLAAAVQLGTAARAAAALVRAAGVAVRRSAYTVAEGLLDRAARLWRTAPGASSPAAELDALTSLFFVERVVYGHDAALARPTVERARQLAERLGRTDVLARLLWTEWQRAAKACHIERAAELTDSLCELAARDHHPLVQGLCCHARGARAWESGHLQEAVDLLDEALEHNRRWAATEPGAAGDITAPRIGAWPVGHPLALFVHALVGDLDDLPARFRAMADADPHPFGATVVWMFAGMGALAVGRFDEAAEYGRRSRVSDPTGAFSYLDPGSQICHGAALAAAGDLGAGLALVETARPALAASDTQVFLPLVEARLAQGLARGGRLDEASTAAERAARLSVDLQQHWALPIVAAVEAELGHHRGAPASETAGALERAAALATEQGALAVAAGILDTAAAIGVAAR